jgi:hypothetical protein
MFTIKVCLFLARSFLISLFVLFYEEVWFWNRGELSRVRVRYSRNYVKPETSTCTDTFAGSRWDRGELRASSSHCCNGEREGEETGPGYEGLREFRGKGKHSCFFIHEVAIILLIFFNDLPVVTSDITGRTVNISRAL